MKRLTQAVWMSGILAVLLTSSANVMAQQDRPDRQNRQNFDPEQMRQRMMDRYRERLEVKGDDEWKIIQTRIEKVTAARQEVGGGFGGMMAGGRRGAPGGAPEAEQGANANRRPGGMGRAELPEAEALQKAIDDKASNEEIKTKLASLREARKGKEAALEKAQGELRAVLNVRQEAEAVLMGLLK
ncbi:MAG: hypothetical protein ACYC23_14235 [Limisphaerales bacterium]